MINLIACAYYPEYICKDLSNVSSNFNKKILLLPNKVYTIAEIDAIASVEWTRIIWVPNRGGDVGALIAGLKYLDLTTDKCLVYHTKKSSHLSGPERDVWVNNLMDVCDKVISHPRRYSEFGYIGSLGRHFAQYDSRNFFSLFILKLLFGLDLNDVGYTSGKIFIIQEDVLQIIGTKMSPLYPFLSKRYRKDGGIEHALERLFFQLAASRTKALLI